MGIQTDLSGSPYFDDFNENKNFHRILFTPSVAVQTRELNQIQTMQAQQLSKFADNIYKQGTIIDGCNFSFHSNIPYVKIKDIETNGTRAIVENYKSHYVKNSANLIAEIVEVASGFQSTTNTNTLFVNYLNSGNSFDSYSYSADDVLTIYNKEGTLEQVNIIDGSVGFSNNDSVVVLSSIKVTNSTGGTGFPSPFVPGEIITDNVNANVEIVEVDEISDPTAIILRIKPLSVDLTNNNANSEWWTITANTTFAANSKSGVVNSVIGDSATAMLITSPIGNISKITITNPGRGYTIDPTISIVSSSATVGQINNLNIEPQTYIARIAVTPSSSVPTGTGYGVSVDQGYIYQKGAFVRVDRQFIIVSRYTAPDDLVVGFETKEEIINANIDTSLLDNALGEPNEKAPGANRLKLTPILTVKPKSVAEADAQFLSVIEFSGGQPYQQRKQTQYNIINDEMSTRTNDISGNFVLDRFLLNTVSETNFAKEANSFIAAVDPGTAYIQGYRVSTDSTYNLSVAKGTDTVNSSVITSMNYGSYIRINEVGGNFKFNAGEQITLYDAATQYITDSAGQTITAPPSNVIGYARIRSITHESGIPGTRSAVYRLYVFDIEMSSGKNFSDVRSVFYNGTNKSVADVVTENDPSTSSLICKLYDSNLSALVFKNGVDATKSIDNHSYIYRMVNDSLTANSSGYVVFNAGVNETFPYPSGSMSTNQERDIIVTPLSNGVSSSNIGGSVAVYTTNAAMVGTSTTFLNDLNPGDWVRVANSTANVVVQVASISNNTLATLSGNASANIVSNAAIYFPMNVPVSLEPLGRFANVSASSNQMTIYLGTSLASDVDVSVTYNLKTTASQVDKTVHRNSFVRLKLANNEAGVSGPWALGVPDVFRLRNVYTINGAANTISINAVSAVANSDDFIMYPNHLFANGDSLVYTGGTYNIPGISNGSTYFVFSANSSGFKLSSDNTNPIAINATATNDVSHTFTGEPTFFGPNTYGVRNITNDFYIDHNQTENYYNTSYLYKVANNEATLSNTDVLLVEFDCFSHAADAGIKHIESYNIDDTLTLAESETTINTLEIPQLYSVRDEYYDLRDSVDVRPHVVPTANISANTLTTYSINPIEPAANAKFSSTNKKFPAPESSFVGDIEYYVGRVDRVVIDSFGDIRSIKGEPGTDNIAIEPINSLTLNVLKIPPYPSYPLSLSEETIKIADTKIANEKYLFKRLIDYRVKTTFTSADIRDEQPKVYKMSDIGSLDRRISDLEYYVSLSLAENSIKNKVIPSSIDASIDRFKYGFFVDSFSDTMYSDLDHPEYSAAVIDGDLVPNFRELNLEFKFNTANSQISSMVRGGKAFLSAYDEYSLINQPVATNGPISQANTSSPDVVEATKQVLTSIDIINRSTNYSVFGTAYEEWAFTFSNTAFSPIELFMNCTDNDTAVVVYQSSSPTYNNRTITTTSQYATPNLARTQYVARGGKAYMVGGRSRWENDTGFRPGGPAEAGSRWIEDSYRMSWNHNPSLGRYYIIRVYKGSHLVSPSSDAPRGTYAFRLWYPIDITTSETTPTTTTPANFQYQGTIELEKTKASALTTIKPYDVAVGSYKLEKRIVSNPLAIELNAYGLKPNTLYKVYLDGVDYTGSTILRDISGQNDVTTWMTGYPSVIPAGNIVSDGYGKLSIVIFKSFDFPSSDFDKIIGMSKNLTNTSQVLICSSDISVNSILSDKNKYKAARSYAKASITTRIISENNINKTGGVSVPYSISLKD